MQKKSIFIAVPALLAIFAVYSVRLTAQEEKEPAVVTALEGQVPSDAIVLFGGKDLSEVDLPGWPAGGLDRGGWRDDCQWGRNPHQKAVRRYAAPCRVRHPHASQRRGPGPWQQRSLFAGQLRGTGARFLREQDLYRRDVRSDLQNISAGGQCLAPGRRVADLRYRFPRGEVRQRREIDQKAECNCPAQRRADPGPCRGGGLPAATSGIRKPRGPFSWQDHNHPVKYRYIWVRSFENDPLGP